MAGSPRYLQLLDNVAKALVPVYLGGSDWEYLDQRWYHLTQRQSTHNLQEIATVSFQIIARETKQGIDKVLADARQLHINKNAGYAGASNPDPWANFRLSDAFGVSPVDGVLVRMSDKYIRIQNLRKDATNERVGESLMDTLRDLAAYALIAICLMEEKYG